MTNSNQREQSDSYKRLILVFIFIFSGIFIAMGQDPTTTITPNDTTICADLSSFYIDFATTANDSAVKWTSPSFGPFSPMNDTTTYLPTAADKSAGSVTLWFIAYPKWPSTHIDSSFLILRFSNPPIITPVADQISCTSYQLPAIAGSNISPNAAYFTGMNRTGVRYDVGDNITTSGTLYINDSSATCSDEESFYLTIDTPPIVNAGNDTTICSGQNFVLPSLHATASNHNGILWTTNGTGTISSGASGLTPTYTPGVGETGTITLTLTATAIGSCSNLGDDFILTINPQPIISNPGPITRCSSYTLPTVPGSNITVNAAYFTGMNRTGVRYDVGDNITTSGTLYINDSTATCSDEESFYLTIDTPPIVNAGNDTTICSGQNFILPSLHASASNHGGILWTTNGTGSISSGATSLTPTYTPGVGETGTITLTLTATAIGSCSNASNDFILTINPQPIITPLVDQRSCTSYEFPPILGSNISGNAAYFTAPNGGGTEYAVGDSIFVSDQIYIYDNNGGCNSEEDFMVIIDNTPTVNAGVDQTICSNGNATLNAVGNSTDNSTIIWTDIGGGTFSNTSVLDPTFTPSATQITNGYADLTITVNGSQACSSTTVSDVVRILITEPTVNAGGDIPICSNGIASLNASATNHDAASIVWTAVGGGTFSSTATLNPTFTPSASQISSGYADLTISVNGLGVCSGRVVSDIVRVLITDAPTVNAGANITICSNSSASLSATANDIDNTSINWTAVGGGTFSSTSLVNPTFTPSASQITNGYADLTISVSGSGTCSGTTVSDVVRVIITAAPTINAGVDQTICADGNATISASGVSIDLTTISWTDIGGGAFSSTSVLNPTFTPSAGQITNGYADLTISVHGLGTCSGTIVTDIIRILITDPSINAGGDIPICSDGNASLNAVGNSIDNTTINWTAVGGGTFSSTALLNPTFTPSASQITNGYADLTISVNGSGACSGTTVTDVVRVVITDAPTVNAGTDPTICSNSSASLNATTNGADLATISWSAVGGGTFSSTTALDPTFTPSASQITNGYADLTISVNGIGACSGTAVTDVVRVVITEPTVDAGPDGNICGVNTHTLNGSATNYDASTIVWTIITGNGSLSATNILNPVYTPTIQDYGNPVRLSMTVNGSGVCSSTTYTDEVYLYYSENVVVDAGPATAIICENSSYTTSASTNAPSTYQWTRNVDGDGTFDDDELLNPTYTPGAADIAKGTVTLTLTATGAGTCLGTSIDQIVLQIKSLPIVNAGPTSVNICETSTYITSAAAALNYDNLTWTIIEGGGSISSASSLTTAEYIPGQVAINQGYAILRLSVTSLSPCFTTDFDEIRINITPEPEITVGIIPTLCVGVPYQVTIVDTAYSSAVAWTLISGTGPFADGNLITPTYTPTATDAVNGTITLRLVASATSPCTASSTQNIVFPVAAAPTVELGADITVCEGTTSITLNPTVTNGVSYQWTKTGGDGINSFSDRFTESPTYNPSAADYAAGNVRLTLVVTGTSLCSSTVTDFLDVYFTPAPTAYVKALDSVCTGSSYYFSSAAATNYSSISWVHDGNGTLSVVDPQKPTYTSVTADAGTDITFTMTVHGNGTCTSVQDQMVLRVLRPPTISMINDVAICGSSFQITGVDAFDEDGLLWTSSSSGTGFTPSASSLNPLYTLTSTDITNGFVQLTLTASAISPQCSVDASKSFIINLVDAPVANAGPDVPICETQNYITSSASHTDGTSFLWEIVSGSGILNNVTSLQAATYEPSDNDINLGSFTLRLTASGDLSCPSYSDEVTITINKQPIVDAGAAIEACVGQQFTVSGASVLNTSSYTWTTTGAGTLTDISGLTPKYTPHVNDLSINGGVISLILTATSSSPCTGNIISTQLVTVYNEPTAYAGANANACAGSTYEIQGATATYASDYIWTSSSGGTFTNNHTLTPTYQVNSNDASNTYVDITLTAIPKSPCATPAAHTFRLSVLAGPTADAGVNSTVCADGIYTNTDADTTNATSVLWQTSGDGIFSSTTAIQPTYTAGTADKINGSVTLTLNAYGIGSNGCNHDVSDLTLTINKLPTADAGSLASICEGSNIITGASVANNSGLVWRIISGTGTLINPTSLTPIYNTSNADTAAGTISLELIALPNAPCSDSAFSTISLAVAKAPTVDIVATNAAVCGITSYSLLGGVTSNDLINNTFTWTSSGSGEFSDINSPTPNYLPSAADVIAGAVTLTITASNSSCTDATDFMTLNIESLTVDAGTDAIVCTGSDYTFAPTIIGNHGTVTWSVLNSTGAGSFSNANDPSATYISDPTDAGKTVDFEIRVVQAGACAGANDATSTISVEFKNTPEVSAGIDTTICENEIFEFPLAHATEQYITNVFWTSSGDGVFSGSGTTQPTYVPGEIDIAQGYVDLTIHGESPPCQEVTDVMRLSFSRLPIVDAGSNATVDIGASFTVNSASATNYASLSWTMEGGTGTLSDETTLTPTYVVNDNDLGKSVKLILSAIPTGSCTNPVTDEMIITIGQSPVVDFSASATCENTDVQFLIDRDVTDIGAIATYSWDFGDGNSVIFTTPDATHLYATQGSYQVTLEVTDTASYTNIIWHNVDIKTNPIANFSYDQPSCSGLITKFNDHSTAPSGYIVEWYWDFGDGSDPITVAFGEDPNVEHTFPASETYPVRLTVKSSDSCSSTTLINVEVTAAPIAAFNYSNSCFEEATQFTDISTNTGNVEIIKWTWDFGDPTTGANNSATNKNPLHIFSTSGSFDVSVITENLNGCIDDTTMSITIASPLTIDFQYTTVCLNEEVSFTPTSNPNFLYSWDFGDGTPTANYEAPTHTFEGQGPYEVILTVIDTTTDCSASVSHPISFTPLPSAVFSISEARCVNEVIEFTNHSYWEGIPIVKWEWDFGDESENIIITENQNPNVEHQYLRSGNFDVSLVVTNENGCTDTLISEQAISIKASPTAFFNFDVGCFNGETTFNDSSYSEDGSKIIAWLWYFDDPASGNLNTATIPNPSHTFVTPDREYYEVNLQVTNENGCVSDTTIEVGANLAEEVDFNILGGNCLGNETTFEITKPLDLTGYIVEWNFGDPVSGQANTSSEKENPSHYYLVADRYEVTLTIFDENGCSNSITKTVNVKPLPGVRFDTDAPLCQGKEVRFTYFYEPNGSVIDSLRWDFGDNTDTIIYRGENWDEVTHLYLSAGIKKPTLTIYTEEGCEVQSDGTYEIEVLRAPEANFLATAVCIEHFAEFTDRSTEGEGGEIIDWVWDFGDPESGNNSSRGIPDPKHIYENSGLYEVSLTITDIQGCTDDTTKIVEVFNEIEIKPFTYTGPICENTTAEFFMNDSINLIGVDITWDFGDLASGTQNTSDEENPTHFYEEPGDYIVTLTLDNGKCGGSIERTITVSPKPIANFEFVNACVGKPTAFTDISTFTNISISEPSPIDNWYWNFGVENLTNDTSTLQNPLYTYNDTGTYLVSLEVSNIANCTDIRDTLIVITPSPTAQFSFEETGQGEITFTNESEDATAFEWDFGDYFTSDEINPVHQYDSVGTLESSKYEGLNLQLVSLNDFECADTAIHLYDLYFKGLYIPTAFIPDPNNPLRDFKPIGVNLQSFNIEVYSSWGQLVWQSSFELNENALDKNGRPTESWNGIYNGENSPPGPYLWKASGVFKDGSIWKGNDLNNTGSGSTSGTIILIR